MHMTHCPIGQIAHGESSYGTTHRFVHLVLQIIYHAWGSHPARHHVHAHAHILLPSRSVQVHCLIRIQLVVPCALSSPGQLYGWYDRSFDRRYIHVPDAIRKL